MAHGKGGNLANGHNSGRALFPRYSCNFFFLFFFFFPCSAEGGLRRRSKAKRSEALKYVDMQSEEVKETANEIF
jgi:hypothetical protein